MRLINLEAVVPGLRGARAAERLNRAMAFARVTRSVLGIECVPLTPRHRLELQLGMNAFSCGASMEALEGDVFQFLWQLNPAWLRWQPITLRATVAWRKIKAVVKWVPIEDQRRAVMEYLAAMLQDLPECGGERDSANPAEGYVHWMAAEAAYYMRFFNYTLETYKDESYLVLQQLYRARELATDPDATFINASDRLVSDWQRSMRKAVAREN